MCKGRTIVFLLIGILIANSSFAQSDSTEFNQWNFRISPYFWFAGFRGTIYRPPQPSNLPETIPRDYEFDIDVSFKELSNNIKFAFMGAGEYRIERFVTQFNISSIILEGEAVTPLDLVLQNTAYRFSYVSGDWGAGYFIFNRKRLELGLLLGLKYIYFDIGGSTNLLDQINFEGSRSVFWFDPILAFRTKYTPHPRLEIVLYGDSDGGLVNDDLNYQFIGTVNFTITKWFLVSTGYRHWGLKTDRFDAIYSGDIHGLIFRLGFQF